MIINDKYNYDKFVSEDNCNKLFIHEDFVLCKLKKS